MMDNLVRVETIVAWALYNKKKTSIYVTHQSCRLIEHRMFDDGSGRHLGYLTLYNDATTERVLVSIDYPSGESFSFGVPFAYDKARVKELIEEKLDVQH